MTRGTTSKKRSTTSRWAAGAACALAASLLTPVAAVVAVVAPVGAADAMPAGAIGKPLPVGDLPAGTIAVRVIAGDPSIPVTGQDVTLVVGGAPRVARTDAAGRAQFAGLPAGAEVQAKVAGEDGKEVTSDVFPVPGQGGVRVMLSTKPVAGGAGPMAGGAAAGGGAMGMPPPRDMSGQPQPDRSAPTGTYAVRVTYNDLRAENGAIVDPNPPVNHPVFLVAYAADSSVKVLPKQTSAEGVALYEGLDTSGATAYYALAALPRGAVSDRLIAVGAIPDGQAGMRVVLSGERRDSTAPAIDDLGKLVPVDPRVIPPGRVRVALDGLSPAGSQITLHDASTGAQVGAAPAVAGAPDPAQVRGNAKFEPDAAGAIQPGTLLVDVKGGMGTATAPLGGITVQLVGADDDQPIGAPVTTGADGKIVLAVPPGEAGAVKAAVTVNGKQLASSPMDLTAAGGTLVITAQWPSAGRPEATFDLPYAPGQVLYAQTQLSGQVFRSLPMLTVPDAGTNTTIYVYPRTLFTFDTHSFVEDQLLAFQGTIEITNYAWAPYQGSKADGLVVELPEGHKGAILAPQDQNDVAVAQGVGFRLMRAIPPGGRKFRMGFSMPIEHGEVDVRFPLPMGSWRSSIKIRQTPGMVVRGDLQGQIMESSTGDPWFVAENVTVDPGKPLAFSIAGFPAEAAWRRWAPRVVGLAVLALMLGGIAYALGRRPARAGAGDDATAARRQQLLDELVDLERRGASSGKDRARREQLIGELERLWGE